MLNPDRIELLRNINHSLRSPLNSVLNQTELLLLGLEGELSESVRAAIVDVREDMNRLDKNIIAVLELVRVATSGVNSENAPIAVLIQRAIDAVKAQAVNNEIVVKVAPDCAFLPAHGDALYIAILQLVCYFAQVSKRTIQLVAQCGQGEVQIRVGVNWKSASDAALFKDELSIGILLCQTIIEKQGGTLQVDGEQGGFAFNIVLPSK